MVATYTLMLIDAQTSMHLFKAGLRLWTSGFRKPLRSTPWGMPHEQIVGHYESADSNPASITQSANEKPISPLKNKTLNGLLPLLSISGVESSDRDIHIPCVG
jgi:hypothetical protein